MVPQFGISADVKAYEILCSTFPGEKIVGIDCSTIAREGGVLNCITWSFLK